MDKKLQVFISSTYVDLKEERQVAVKSILESGHIPAGMELFTANSEEQWNVIKKWIDNSDIYLLILGGRYGTINNQTEISYTEMEYDYAVTTNKPIISIVLSDFYLDNIDDSKISRCFERDNPKYISFKNKITHKMVKIIDKIEDIDSLIPKAILEIERDEDIYLTGWLRGDFSKVESKFKIGELSFNELNNCLRSKEFLINENYQKDFGKKISGLDAYIFIKHMGGSFASSYVDKSCPEQYFYNVICPYFISLGLLEIYRVTGRKYYRTRFTKNGIKYNQLFEKIENK